MKVWLSRPAVRLGLALLATAALLVPLGVMWVHSLVPSTYSAMDMGYADFGGATATGGDHRHGGKSPGHGAARQRSVASLTGPKARSADVDVRLVARKQKFTLRSGERLTGYTLNGSSPGPLIRARQGDLVQVTLENDNVSDGVTLHWHGIDVPNAEDGVAGVTQDAVAPGGKHVYRFLAADAGTYWYHSHQVSHEQVRKGLFGTFVIDPAAAVVATVRRPNDITAAVHTYAGGLRTINGRTGRQHVAVPPSTPARVRVVNTNNGALTASVTGVPYRLVAVDGNNLNKPAAVRGRSLLVAAGGRADLEVTTPSDGSSVRVDVGGGGTYLTIGGKHSTPVSLPRRQAPLDLLTYGATRPIEFDPAAADRTFDYRIGRRFGFVDGKPGLWWSINGKLFPNVPMFVVAEGDIVRMRLKNTSGQVHPMHLHGHHALVLSRNGERATGSPWWVDSLNVANGETYEIAFRADNPGIWMDHCHNLDHAAEGLVAHLAYEGVTEPFKVGGKAHNHPE